MASAGEALEAAWREHPECTDCYTAAVFALSAAGWNERVLMLDAALPEVTRSQLDPGILAQLSSVREDAWQRVTANQTAQIAEAESLRLAGDREEAAKAFATLAAMPYADGPLLARFAQGLAQTGNPSDAIVALERAVADGYLDRNELLHSPRLESLWSNTAYLEFVREVFGESARDEVHSLANASAARAAEAARREREEKRIAAERAEEEKRIAAELAEAGRAERLSKAAQGTWRTVTAEFEDDLSAEWSRLVIYVRGADVSVSGTYSEDGGDMTCTFSGTGTQSAGIVQVQVHKRVVTRWGDGDTDVDHYDFEFTFSVSEDGSELTGENLITRRMVR